MMVGGVFASSCVRMADGGAGACSLGGANVAWGWCLDLCRPLLSALCLFVILHSMFNCFILFFQTFS